MANVLPPSLPSHPLIQSIHHIRRPLEFIEECHRCLGDIFTLPLVGMGKLVLVASPKDVKTLFNADPEVIQAGKANKKFMETFLGSRSSLTMDGAAHHHRRRLLLPAFQGEQLPLYADSIRDITDNAIASWPLAAPFALMPKTQDITVEVMLRLIFGVRSGEVGELGRLARRLSTIGVGSPIFLMPMLQWDLGKYSPWGRILHLIRQTDVAIYDEIHRRRRQPEGDRQPDLLSLFLTLKDEEDKPLPDQVVRDELITALMAGHETTGAAIAWALERILSSPDVLSKVDAELTQVTGGAALNSAHFSALEYLDATVKEVLRCRPPTPYGSFRLVVKPFEIGGYTLPPGTLVANCMYLLMRRPELFPEPDRFRPERFLEKKENGFEWTPFGAGPRRCTGMAFALYSIKVVVATILTRLRLHLERMNLRMVRRGFLLEPEGGARVIVDGRKGARTGSVH